MGQNPGTIILACWCTRIRKTPVPSDVNPCERGLEAFAHPKTLTFWAVACLSDLYLQYINGDVAFLKGMMKHIFKRRGQPGTILDHAFITEHTTGFEAFKKELDETSWDEIVEESGLVRSDIEAAADIYCNAKASIVCWAMGLTQHKNGVANIQEVVNLLLLKGNFGRPGAGACPVRGHSNVQGDRTVGIVERPTDAFLNRLARTFEFEPPREHGFDVVESIHAMHDERASVFFAMGGNFVAATPDTHYTEEALRKCALTVQVSTS